MKKNIVLYHKNCPDGSTAAAVAYKKFASSADYFACSHGDGLPEEVKTVENKKSINIYILDFSFDVDTLKIIENDFASLIILDHHYSVREIVISVKGGHFDNSKSGASMAWNYFFKDEPIPDFVKIIETIDLHKDVDNKLEDIGSYISSIDYELETYTNLLDNFDKNYQEYKKEGKAINRYVALLEQMIVEDFDVVEFEGVAMPAVNITFDISTRTRILAKLYEIMPPVSMSYRYKNGKWKISLRSNSELFDVTQIASKYKGGGHKGAAGCVIEAPSGELFFKPLGKWSEYQKTILK